MVNITTNANGGLTDIRPGEKLTCSASGKPAPTYQWKKLAGQGQPDVLDRADLIVKSEMEGENKYTCVASNAVGNEVKSTRKDVTFTVSDEISLGIKIVHFCHQKYIRYKCIFIITI